MTSVLSNAGCNIALYYYSGFCYLQLRRYTDAARAFNSVLTYIARCGVLQRKWRPPVMNKGVHSGLSLEWFARHKYCLHAVSCICGVPASSLSGAP